MTADKVSWWIEKIIMDSDGKENLLTVMAKLEFDIVEAIRVSGLFGEMKINDNGEWEPKNAQAETGEAYPTMKEENPISE